ncbi:KAT8 regulatory NSL complex subunit 3 [Ceratina calcarata]|uniref:KAT8 regulatory NSL complex subunit 3 n=1 Tax=Ceratina calcarata TaxID=156304 RepID=A0AAJ7NDE5_9HYME|nr:KAT8 regulatory NSL complex subunit 3 [Ceratina calcarata]
MLISTSTMPSTSLNSSRIPSPISDTFDDNPSRLTKYLHQLAGCYETEIDVLAKDHCYARPWNWRPENVYAKPIKKLFFPKKDLSSDKGTPDEDIDIEEDINAPMVPPIDFTRVKHQMDELQQLSNFARPDENDDWEEKLDKILWTPVQNRIFTKVLKILNSERLTRLSKVNNPIEPIYRRTSVDTAARRFRETLASAGWDWRVAQWLHHLLFDHLPQEYLGIYLDILQNLRLKIPQLIDKMIAVQPNINAKTGSITWETLGSLLKRTWDPVAPSLNSNRLKKLPGNPILIIVPSGVGFSMSARQHKWISQLGALGMVVTVNTHLGLAANRMTMMVCIDQLVQATRTKIQDIRSDCPGRPIILVGFNTGAALACQVAQIEHVTAVICLGFPFNTAEGKRGTPDDTLLDIRCPVMFVIGQCATLIRHEDLEEVREKMMVETSLVVVGTADDNLRISTVKKISKGITQNMVDKCILDEIGDFVGTILLQPHPLPLRSTSLSNYENKNNRKERKRRNSTSSSVESEPTSPTVKKSRPNTPISTVVSVGQNTQSTAISRVGTFSTQSNIIAVSGTHANHTQTVKRKPRVINNQKAPFVEHLITSRLSAQSNSNSDNGGITLNIGSLASLAPIGPIRLAPTSSGQVVSAAIKTIPKQSVASNKVPKIVSNVQLQNVSKMKTIVSSGKGFPKVISHNYRHLNIPDKSGDTKLVNVLTTSGSQIRVNTSNAAAIHSKSTVGTSNGTLSNILQNGKNSLAVASSSSSARVSVPPSILLTPCTSTSVTTSVPSTTSPITKVMDDMATTSSSSHAMLTSTHSLDTFKKSQLPRQVTTSNKNDNNNSHNASCGNIIMVENSLNAKPACSPMIVPISSHGSGTIVPLSNKLKVAQSTKTMPKITVNASNLQRIHKPQIVQKHSLVNEIDDDLGNILDIPIIFAKDDDNLNSIEKSPSVSQTVPVDVHEKNPTKLTSNTKVVLISNKQDKQSANKFVTPSQAIICPNANTQNLNHIILQTKHQNPVLSKTKTIPIQTRSSQPTVKYTKIILAKRNSQTYQNDKSEQVILTKPLDKMNAKLLNVDASEHRYAQVTTKSKIEDNTIGETLEIEDAIKMNIIERKRIELPSQTSDNIKDGLIETTLNDENKSECTKVNNVTNL